MSRSREFLFILFACAVFATPDASALQETLELGELRATVYGPDWIWQREAVNVLIVLQNEGGTAAELIASIVLPEGDPAPFETEDRTSRRVWVAPETEGRIAFTHLIAQDDVPLGTYALAVTIEHEGARATANYPVRIIRGAAVSSRRSAAFVPAALASLWCIVFGVVMFRMATRGAWKKPSAPVSPPDAPEPWIEAQP